MNLSTEDRFIRVTDPGDPRIAGFTSIRERDLIRQEKSFIAEGTVVLSMLAGDHARSNGFEIRSLLILENRLEGLGTILEKIPADIPVHIASQTVMDGIVGFNMHRGVLALGTRSSPLSRHAILSNLPDRALVLAACGISNHDNIGALFRNAAAFGVDAVLLDDTCCDPLYRKALRVSVGTVLAMPFARDGHADDILTDLVGHGFDLWGLSPSGKQDIRTMPASARIALLAGTEGEGLPAPIMARIKTMKIPQNPAIDSLNVATATGIALYEAASRMGKI